MGVLANATTRGGPVVDLTGTAEPVADELERLYQEHYRGLVKLASFYVDDVGSAEVGGVAATEQDRIIAALRTLPERQAAVLVLRYYHDLSEAEIAETLSIARGSVKSHAHRGLAKLAVALGESA